MRLASRVLLILIMLLVALSVLTFVLENQRAVELSFLGWSTAQLPVAVLMVLSLILGMLIGPVLAWLYKRRRISSNQLATDR